MPRTAARSMGLGLAVALAVYTVPAEALSYSDILGRWCGDRTNQYLTNVYFAPDSFTTTWPLLNNDSKTRAVVRYESTGATIKMHWIHEGAPTWIMYGEFSPDGRRMVQLPTSTTSRYIFYRC